jgi:hypothetical protein
MSIELPHVNPFGAGLSASHFADGNAKMGQSLAARMADQRADPDAEGLRIGGSKRLKVARNVARAEPPEQRVHTRTIDAAAGASPRRRITLRDTTSLTARLVKMKRYLRIEAESGIVAA